MVPIVISPGWRDSPSSHWQSLWAEQLADAVRVPQDGAGRLCASALPAARRSPSCPQ